MTIKIQNSVNLSYLIINNVNGYFEENNGSKCLALVPTKEKKKIKNMKNWRKIRYLFRSTTDDYDKKYMKIKFHSDDQLPRK